MSTGGPVLITLFVIAFVISPYVIPEDFRQGVESAGTPLMFYLFPFLAIATLGIIYFFFRLKE